MQGCRESSAWPVSRVLSSQTAYESAAPAPAAEATYGRGISRGGSPSESPPPHARPPSPSWKEKKPIAGVRKIRLSWQRPRTWKSVAPPAGEHAAKQLGTITPWDPSRGPVRWASFLHLTDEEIEVSKGDVTNRVPSS